MHANIGDELVVHSRHVGDHDRRGVITQIHGDSGAPPYDVKSDDGKEALFFPSADCTIAHARLEASADG